MMELYGEFQRRFEALGEAFDELLFEANEGEQLRRVHAAIADYDKEIEEREQEQAVFERGRLSELKASTFRDGDASPGTTYGWDATYDLEGNRLTGWIPRKWHAANRPPDVEILNPPFALLSMSRRLVLLAALHDGLLIRRKELIRPRVNLREAKTCDFRNHMNKLKPFDRLLFELCGLDCFENREVGNGVPRETRWLRSKELLITLENTLTSLRPRAVTKLDRELVCETRVELRENAPFIQPKKLLFTWDEICEALKRDNDDKFHRLLTKLSKETNGPIRIKGRGKQPVPVDLETLIIWWNSLENMHRATQEQDEQLAADKQASFSKESMSLYGRKGIVCHEVGGSIKVRKGRNTSTNIAKD